MTTVYLLLAAVGGGLVALGTVNGFYLGKLYYRQRRWEDAAGGPLARVSLRLRGNDDT